MAHIEFQIADSEFRIGDGAGRDVHIISVQELEILDDQKFGIRNPESLISSACTS